MQNEGDLSGADMQHVVFIVLRAAQFLDDFPQHVILAGADCGRILRYKVMDGEDIRQLHVERWLGPCVEVVVFINVELGFSIADIDYYPG
jgi:hypothetical protein